MSARRSRALDAAVRATAMTPADAPPSTGGLTRAQVETCARVFDELERLPDFEEHERRSRAHSLVSFIARVERGEVRDDARALALAVASRGAAWLAEHPALVCAPTRAWGVPLIEAAILSFNAHSLAAVRAPAPSDGGDVAEHIAGHVAEEMVGELVDLEAVLAAGGVEAGEAEDLAHAFLAYAHRWLARHPGVLARYRARL